GVIVVLGKEDRRVIVRGTIFVKQLIHRSKEPLRLFRGYRALAAQIRLKICHQQSSRDALARDVANHQAEPPLAELQKIVIIAANGASRVAKATIGDGSQRRMPLREEARFSLLGDCQVVSGLALGLQLCRFRTALGINSTCRLVDFDQRETISVHIFEKGVPRLPPPPRAPSAGVQNGPRASTILRRALPGLPLKADSGVLANAPYLLGPFAWNN